MDYERLVSIMKDEKVPPVPDRLWDRIEGTLQEKKEHRVRWTMFNIMPTLTLAGAAAVFAGILCLNYVHNAQVISYVKMLGSTEYIYEQCKYPG